MVKALYILKYIGLIRVTITFILGKNINKINGLLNIIILAF